MPGGTAPKNVAYSPWSSSSTRGEPPGAAFGEEGGQHPVARHQGVAAAKRKHSCTRALDLAGGAEWPDECAERTLAGPQGSTWRSEGSVTEDGRRGDGPNGVSRTTPGGPVLTGSSGSGPRPMARDRG